MNMKMIAGACLCAAAIVGCVSVEQTRQQLQSKDPAQVKLAEENIIKVVSYQALTSDMPEKYVDLVESNELLGKIIGCSQDPKTVMAAINKLDPSKPGTPNELLLKLMEKEDDKKLILMLSKKIDMSQKGISMEILTKHEEIMSKVDSAEFSMRTGNKEKSKDENFESHVIGGLTELELRKCLESDIRRKDEIALRMIDVTEDTAWLYKMFKNKLSYSGWGEPSDNAANRLAKLADKIEDENVMQEILEREDDRWRMIVKDPELRMGVLKRMNETNAIGLVEGCLWRHFGNSSKFGRTDWDTGYFAPIGDAATLAMISKNPKTVVKMEAAVYSAIDHYEDGERKSSFLAKLPKLTEEGMIDLLCYDEHLWKKFIDNVSVDVAYKVLASGRAKSSEFEVALLKKLPKERIDLNVYNGVHADSVKKRVLASMSPECQKQVREANEKAFAAIVEKAKSASKHTFEIEGFYLGMSWEDMKIVLAHHFPELEAKEKDDDGLELYVSNQKSAFCFADKEKKIYQFNFGKKMLKKWYKYDAQDYAQWVSAYSRENKINMQYKMVEKEATVYEPMDMSRSYRVWFYQHSYQYKHNTKEYRLTYFGDEKDFTVHGGIGGALIKELAAPKFRYTRGDPGSLRVRIEKD